MNIKLSKSQWELIGKKTGWLKRVAQTPSVGKQIGTAFQGVAQGLSESANAKVQEYAQRIMNGEDKNKVLEGLGPTMIKNVESTLAKLQQPQQPQQQQQQQQPKQMKIFNENYQSLIRTLNSLAPNVQNQASSAFSNAYNFVKAILDNPDSWMS